MVASNTNRYLSRTTPNPNVPAGVLAGRVRRYFRRHPDVTREQFLVDAVGHELRRREDREAAGRTPLTKEDIRIHVWLNQRLAVLHRERHGFGARMRRFFLRNHLLRWLFSGR